MSYIGRDISNLSDRAVLDSISTSATATFNLLLNSVAYVPSSAESLTVSLNGVIQAPQSSYTVSGSTIIFASNLASTDVIDFILAERAITLTTIGSGTVTTSNIVDGNVTNAKLANSSITLNGSAVSLGGSATIGGGKIGQLINATQNSEVTTSSTSRVASNLTASITPSATSSKVLVLFSMLFAVNRSNAEQYCNYAIQRGGSDIWTTQSVQAWGLYIGNSNHIYMTGNANHSFLDTPSTTNSTTYSITFAQSGGGTAKANAHNSVSTIQLLEVLA